MLDGRVKTLHPKVHGGILARRDLPAHMQRDRAARHPADRSGGRQPLSVRADRRQARLHAGRGDREHRHRRPDHGARGGQEPRARRRGHRSGRLRGAARAKCSRPTARSARRRAFALAKKAFSHTAAYDGAISNYLTALDADGARAAFPAPAQPAASPRCRICATARIRTRTRRSTATCDAGARQRSRATRSCRARSCPTTTSPTPMRRGNASRPSTQPACVIVKHANPCGVAVAANAAGSLRARLRDRSDLGLRRHHRLQPRARRRQPRRRWPSSSSKC